ncbi:MAG: hypothetical protein KBT06_04340 [Prevotellaceae bacterium]|nr:hypothetical protein [Candidatus Colivivens equi]
MKTKEILDAAAAGQEIYLAVVYCTDLSIHIMPALTKEQAFAKLLKMRLSPKCRDRMMATTIAKRSAQGFNEGKVFGSPKSLDVMQLTDKQFEKAYEKYVGIPVEDADPYEEE